MGKRKRVHNEWNFEVRFPTDKALKRRHAVFAAGRIVREMLGVTAAEAAAQIGISERTVRAWETGERMPTLDYWPRYQRWLLEVFTAYVVAHDPPQPDPSLCVGSSVLRERLGLAGHCERCARLGHQVAHPGVKPRYVGCAKQQQHKSRGSNRPKGEDGDGG